MRKKRLHSLAKDSGIRPVYKRSRLGWSVVGPIALHSTEENIKCNLTKVIPSSDISTGRVSNHYFSVSENIQETSISDRLMEMYATEFNEVASEKKALSHEDLQFLEIMKTGARIIEGKIELPLLFPFVILIYAYRITENIF